MRNVSFLAVTFVLAASAGAQTPRYTAMLAQSLPAKKEFVANGNVWRCQSSTCILVSVPEDPSSVRSCHALQRQAGSLTAYGVEGKAFETDKLAKCNAT